MRLTSYRPVVVNPRTWESQEIGGWMAYDEACSAATGAADTLGWEPAVARDTRRDSSRLTVEDRSLLRSFEYLRSEA